MYSTLSSNVPDIIPYPSNMGKSWTDEEDTILLEYLSNDYDISTIAKYHNRTEGSILARRKTIAYKLHIENIPMDQILVKTRLDEDQFIKMINKQVVKTSKKDKCILEPDKRRSIEMDIAEMKNDIKCLKSTINELVEMMKAVYEFEDE